MWHARPDVCKIHWIIFFLTWPSGIKPAENIWEIRIGEAGRRSDEHSSLSQSISFFCCSQLVTEQGIYWCSDQHLILIIAQWSNCNAGILFELKLWPKPVARREKSSSLLIQIFLLFCFSTCWILGANLSVLVRLRHQNKILLFLLMLHFKCDTTWTIHRSSISWTNDICLKMDVGPNFSKF